MLPTVNSSGSEFFEQANIKTGSEVLFHFIILLIYKQTGRNPVSLSLQGAAETLLRFARRDEVTTRLAPLLTRGESFSKTSACEVWGEKFCTRYLTYAPVSRELRLVPSRNARSAIPSFVLDRDAQPHFFPLTSFFYPSGSRLQKGLTSSLVNFLKLGYQVPFP